jgi:hypothetical protein
MNRYERKELIADIQKDIQAAQDATPAAVEYCTWMLQLADSKSKLLTADLLIQITVDISSLTNQLDDIQASLRRLTA